jgi:hypothetical protein
MKWLFCDQMTARFWCLPMGPWGFKTKRLSLGPLPFWPWQWCTWSGKRNMQTWYLAKEGSRCWLKVCKRRGGAILPWQRACTGRTSCSRSGALQLTWTRECTTWLWRVCSRARQGRYVLLFMEWMEDPELHGLIVRWSQRPIVLVIQQSYASKVAWSKNAMVKRPQDIFTWVFGKCMDKICPSIEVCQGKSNGPKVQWSQSPMVPKSHCHKVPWSQSPMVPKPQGPKVPRSQTSHCPLVTKSHCCMVPTFHGPKVPWSKSPMVPESQGPRVPWAYGP